MFMCVGVCVNVCGKSVSVVWCVCVYVCVCVVCMYGESVESLPFSIARTLTNPVSNESLETKVYHCPQDFELIACDPSQGLLPILSRQVKDKLMVGRREIYPM